jgi:multidrug efflux system membrane fusion protein
MRAGQGLVSFLILSICALLTGLMIWKGRETLPQVAPPIVTSLEVIEVRAEGQHAHVRSQGNLVSQNQITLSSQVEGVIVEISPALKNGGHFQKGDALLRIDSTDYQQALARADAEVAAAKLRWEQASAASQIAKGDWEAFGAMVATEPTRLMFKEPQVEEAKASLDASLATQSKAAKDLAKTTIRAPFSGKVREEWVGEGQFIRRGEALATIYDDQHYEIRLPVSLADLALLPDEWRLPGQTVLQPLSIQLRASIAGQLTQWSASATRLSGVIDEKTSVTHLIGFLEHNQGAKPTGNPSALNPLPGVYVEADIQGRYWPQAVRVPRSAIGPNQQIGVIQEDETVLMQSVEWVQGMNDEVIVYLGLHDGDRIARMFNQIPFDGAQVTPVAITQSTSP